MDQEFYTLAEAAEYLGLKTTGPVFAAIHKGFLPAYRPRPLRNWRIKKTDLDEWIEAGKTPDPVETPPRKRQRRTKRNYVEVLT